MIEVSALNKSFGSLQVLKGIDLTIGKSEVVSITGASGAGKSSLLNILGTLSKPDSGSVSIDGINPFSLDDKRLSQFRNTKIGFVFQAHNLLPEFTALENVQIPAMIAGRSLTASRNMARKLLAEVGLEDRSEHKPSEMSGGEQQRVAIARALVNNPSVLLADEPTGNLDSRTKEEIHKLFFDLRERLGQTIVIVTHDPSLASLCDRSLVMKDGLIVE